MVIVYWLLLLLSSRTMHGGRKFKFVCSCSCGDSAAEPEHSPTRVINVTSPARHDSVNKQNTRMSGVDPFRLSKKLNNEQFNPLSSTSSEFGLTINTKTIGTPRNQLFTTQSLIPPKQTPTYVNKMCKQIIKGTVLYNNTVESIEHWMNICQQRFSTLIATKGDGIYNMTSISRNNSQLIILNLQETFISEQSHLLPQFLDLIYFRTPRPDNERLVFILHPKTFDEDEKLFVFREKLTQFMRTEAINGFDFGIYDDTAHAYAHAVTIEMYYNLLFCDTKNTYFEFKFVKMGSTKKLQNIQNINQYSSIKIIDDNFQRKWIFSENSSAVVRIYNINKWINNTNVFSCMKSVERDRLITWEIFSYELFV